MSYVSKDTTVCNTKFSTAKYSNVTEKDNPEKRVDLVITIHVVPWRPVEFQREDNKFTSSLPLYM